MKSSEARPPRPGWRNTVHEIIFEAETPSGKGFDLALIVLIGLSVVVVMFDSVRAISRSHGTLLLGFEWLFTILFTIEYVLRLVCVRRPARYALSFFGLVDILAIAPTYLSLLLPGSQYFIVIRILRVLRIFRVLKLGQHIGEANVLIHALIASRRKIAVFLYTVMTLVVVLGSLMYLIEGEENGFTSIPRSIYWAIVTLTTVGFGDIAPKTAFGQAVSALVMIVGYGLIAVPTGIVTVALTQSSGQGRTQSLTSTRHCRECSTDGHDADATHCKHCGAEL